MTPLEQVEKVLKEVLLSEPKETKLTTKISKLQRRRKSKVAIRGKGKGLMKFANLEV